MAYHQFRIYRIDELRDSQAVAKTIVRIRKNTDTIDLQVPMNQTGPADSERIPRPVKIEV
jgi:hypothetical protein